jgi:hypothetical protein
MDKCSKCGAATELHENGVPICVKCSEEIESARKRTATDAVDKSRATVRDRIADHVRPPRRRLFGGFAADVAWTQTGTFSGATVYAEIDPGGNGTTAGDLFLLAVPRSFVLASDVAAVPIEAASVFSCRRTIAISNRRKYPKE